MLQKCTTSPLYQIIILPIIAGRVLVLSLARNIAETELSGNPALIKVDSCRENKTLSLVVIQLVILFNIPLTWIRYLA